MRTRLFLRTTLLAVCVGSAITACGDNLTPGGSQTDAPSPDAMTDGTAIDAPDASTAPTVGGTLAVFDAVLSDPSAAAVGGVGGGTIRFSFNDLTMNGGQVVFGTSAIGGCLITRFDATHLPNPRLDAGPITVTGPATGDNALLKTVGPCTLQPTFGEPDPYVCISHNQTTATVAAQDLGAQSAVAYTLGTEDFGMSTPTAIAVAIRGPNTTPAVPANTVLIQTVANHGYATGMFVTIAGTGTFNTGGSPIMVTGANTFVYAQAGSAEIGGTLGTASVPTGKMIGSSLVVNGLSGTNFNSGASAFPVVGQMNASTLIVVNPTPTDGEAQAPDTTSMYTVLNGFSPIPAAGDGRANFLAGSNAPNTASSIRIQKAANSVWPAIDQTIDVPGEARRPVAITTITRTNNVSQATTSVNHDFQIGQILTVAGVADNTFNTTTATVTAITANTFSYTNNGNDGASTGGTAVKPGGFTLDGTSAVTHAFPLTTASAQKYSCDNNTVGAGMTFDDTCGDESTALLKAMIISGSASKKPVTALLPFQMPTEVPGSADPWLEWQCAFIGGRSATMPQAAVQAIIDFAPTRVEQQVLFVGGSILDGTGTNVQTLRVLAGHAIAGHTTPTP
jgi:hypothetical protein